MNNKTYALERKRNGQKKKKNNIHGNLINGNCLFGVLCLFLLSFDLKMCKINEAAIFFSFFLFFL